MKKRVIFFCYWVEGKRQEKFSRWEVFCSGWAKTPKGGKRQLVRLQKEYRTFRFRLIENRQKIVA